MAEWLFADDLEDGEEIGVFDFASAGWSSNGNRSLSLHERVGPSDAPFRGLKERVTLDELDGVRMLGVEVPAGELESNDALDVGGPMRVTMDGGVAVVELAE